MNVLIVGAGSIGMRHLQNIKTLLPDCRVSVWRQTSRDSVEGAEQTVFSLKDALAAQPQLAIIANPAPYHISTAISLAEAGVHLYLEKPLSDSLEGVDRLERAALESGSKIIVGYNLRFHPAFLAIKRVLEEGRLGRVLACSAEVGQYLPEWRPAKDYRETVTARHDLGGGVLLELSHELDYIRWLVGEVQAVSAMMDHVSDLEIDVEDTVLMTLRFANRALGHVHMDMVRRDGGRRCEILCTEGTLRWESAGNTVKMYQGGAWDVIYQEDALDRNVTYFGIMRHFLDCIVQDKTPSISLAEGRATLELVLAARKSAESGSVVSL